VWQSLTPFVPPRHWYRKRIAEGRVREHDNPENQLRATMAENGVATPAASIHRLKAAGTEWDVCRVHLSKQARTTNAEPDHRVGLFLAAHFAEPTVLPLPGFGHSSHFGLGQFRPIDE
jgi:CRISPR-associated protein Csb2